MPRQTIKELCRQAGITPICYYKRLEKGMTKEEALTTPLMRGGKRPPTVHNSCVWEDDHRKNHNKIYKPFADCTTPIGKVFKDEIKRVHAKIKIYSNADFNNALGGYRISILNHIKEGEYRFQIIKLGEQMPFYTNDFQKFSQEINRILTLIRG